MNEPCEPAICRRLLTLVLLGVVWTGSLAAQCEGDLSWEYQDEEEEGFSIGRLFSDAVTPQVVNDTRIIRRYVRDPRFADPG